MLHVASCHDYLNNMFVAVLEIERDVEFRIENDDGSVNLEEHNNFT